MQQDFRGWDAVSRQLQTLMDSQQIPLNDGQKASLRCLAGRLTDRSSSNGMIIADEVGMGKTRIAAAVARAVTESGGRVAVLVPPGLGYQWNEELRCAGVTAPPILRSLLQYLCAWQDRCWFEEPALVISHGFSNWRLGEKSDSWRWLLLPELYARWRKRKKSWPRGYCNGLMPQDSDVQKTARHITAALEQLPRESRARCRIEEIAGHTPWPAALDPVQYGRTEALRTWLERAVGLGLGVFDLVIIDEAHKGRKKDSRLNNLLDQIILPSPQARRLALTATPIELDAGQWMQMLERIQVEEADRQQIAAAVSAYVQAVADIRRCPSDPQRQRSFGKVAEAFTDALSPYLIRRDKRQESSIQKFQQLSGEDIHAYRQETPLFIHTAELDTAWKQAVCAAESLSFVARHTDDRQMKCLRLTLSNGHGIASLLDQLHMDETADAAQLQAESEEKTKAPQQVACHGEENDPGQGKREQRIAWWQEILAAPFQGQDNVLFTHPAILKAVEAIEEVTQRGEKVLVFGRFRRPMQALTQLLNAREMLRCLDEGRFWPQSGLNSEEEWMAAQAADIQLPRKMKWRDKQQLGKALEAQYATLRNDRRNFRKRLVDELEEGFRQRPDRQARSLLAALRQDLMPAAGTDDAVLIFVTRGIQEILGPDWHTASPVAKARAFADLVEAAGDQDRDDSEDDQDDACVSERWKACRERLQEEYGNLQGRFARLMDGNSKPATRRFLQLAFNRPHSHPKVLVAQSLVGREGLNLHTACRTVVLLHLEWNPGVVEQQIGRVDRIGSLWEKKLERWEKTHREGGGAERIPRIEIRPVIFQGTYDERQWSILKTRWNDLRAQLHGLILSPDMARENPEAGDWIRKINRMAPDFSPERAPGTERC